MSWLVWMKSVLRRSIFNILNTIFMTRVGNDSILPKTEWRLSCLGVAIYNAMRQTDGIYGGRFSGAGFKGACIALCDPDKIEAIEQSVREKYLSEFPQYKDAMECYFCDIADGARITEN